VGANSEAGTTYTAGARGFTPGFLVGIVLLYH